MKNQEIKRDYRCISENVPVMEGKCYANPVSTQGKRLLLCRLLSVVIMPLVGLVVFSSVQLQRALSDEYLLNSVKLQLQSDMNIGKFVHAIQLERTENFKLLYLHHNENVGNVSIENAYSFTSRRLQHVHSWPICGYEGPENVQSYLDEKRSHILFFDKQLISEAHALILQFYTDLNACFIDVFLKSVGKTEHKKLWKDIVAYKMLVRAKENVGIYVGLGNVYFSSINMPIAEYVNLRSNVDLMDDHINTATSYSVAVENIFAEEKLKHGDLLKKYKIYKDEIKNDEYKNISDGRYGYSFTENGLQYMEYLRKVKTKLESFIIMEVDREYQNAENVVVLMAFVFLISAVTGPVVIYMLQKLTTKLQSLAKDLSVKSEYLETEKRRAQSLLYQMLPKEVACQLQNSQSVQAEYFEDATVFFSDVVGFTDLSAKSSPIQVVDFLNSLYHMYDECLDHYDVYKVETIGDAYMVVSGIPISNGNLHVMEVALMALDLRQRSETYSIPHLPNEKMNMRMGFHTGPCAAGVVGKKMPRYCLFGDTVNTASRMESTSLPQHIHISTATKNVMDKIGGFITVCRGDTEVKGKGNMKTYWLQDRCKSIDNLGLTNGTNEQIRRISNNEPPTIFDISENEHIVIKM